MSSMLNRQQIDIKVFWRDKCRVARSYLLFAPVDEENTQTPLEGGLR